MNISVVLITYNEEKNLVRTLTSVKSFADEIIIVDSGSTDNTKKIAESFGAKFFFEDWSGYGKQRNSAIKKAKGKWILNIDADEEISSELGKRLVKIALEESEKEVFEINRISVCFGKKIKYGGWGTSYAVRFFRNGSGYFDNNTVHEKFETKNKIYKLKENIFHHSYLTLEDYFKKFNRYTTEGAIEYYKNRKKVGWVDIVLNPMYKFLRMYFFRLGFLDGKEGFLLASTSSLYTMVKYYKLYEIYKNKSYMEN